MTWNYICIYLYIFSSFLQSSSKSWSGCVLHSHSIPVWNSVQSTDALRRVSPMTYTGKSFTTFRSPQMKNKSLLLTDFNKYEYSGTRVFLEKLIFTHMLRYLKPSVEPKSVLLSFYSDKFRCVFLHHKRKCAVQHTTWISHHTLLHVSVRMNHNQGLLFTTVWKHRYIWAWNYHCWRQSR